MLPMFKQGAFQVDANATPDQIAAKRAYIAAMMPRFGSAKYVGEGLGQLATGVVIGRQNRKLNEAEGAGRKSAADQFARLFGTANSAQSPAVQGPMSVLGMTPALPPPVPVDPSNPEAIGSDAMTALGKGATPEGIKAGLVARGMPEHIADGFIMNFQDESGLNPGINEIAPIVPGSRGGFGLAQWTGPRRKALEAFAAERGMPVSDPGVQMDFLMTELQGPEAAAWAKISGAQNAGEAGAAIVNNFLRPAEEHRASRAAEYLGGQGMPSSAAPAPTSAPSIPINELYMALQNPWLSAEEKGLITSMIGEQQQASDPLRQLELRKAEIELAQLENPTQQPPEDFATRMFTLNALQIDPQSEEGKVYLMTGKLPEPPEPGYRAVTPEEAAARLPKGADPSEYQVSPEGKIEKIGGGGVTVNNSIDGGGKFEEAFAKGDATTIETVYNSGLAAQRNLGRIDQLGALLDANPTGAGAAITQFAGSLGIATEGLDEIQAAQALINSLVPEQRQPGSGPMSDADLALFKQSLPQIINSPGGNKIIVGTMRAIAEYDAEGARIVQRLRSGEITRSQAFDALQNRPNPLEGFKPASKAAAPGGTAAPSTSAPDGVEQEVWDALTPEERALWD